MCLAVIHVSLCSRCSSLASQVWETKCILKWEKGDICAWLEKKQWLEHIGSLKLSDGENLAARTRERLVKAVGDEHVADDLFTAVGLVLRKHNRRFDIDADDFADIMEARGTFSHSSPDPTAARCAPTSIPYPPLLQGMHYLDRIALNAITTARHSRNCVLAHRGNSSTVGSR
jgi:hypothetical protein